MKKNTSNKLKKLKHIDNSTNKKYQLAMITKYQNQLRMDLRTPKANQ